MKFIQLLLIGLGLSLTALFLAATKQEAGDSNAISMYFVVFLIPVIIVAIFNAIFITSLNHQQNRNKKIIFSFIPLILMIILSQLKNLHFNLLDGSISFAGFVCAAGIGITNIIWAFSLFRNE